MPEHAAAIALGSNLSSTYGAPADNLREGIRRLTMLGRVSAVSSFYTTKPVGFADQPDFLNAAVLLQTRSAPVDLLRDLLAIELTLGRNRAASPPKGPRTLDLDLLLYDEVVLTTEALTLPHPAMHERRFVLEPLAEIAPGLRHPLLGKTVQELLSALG